AERLACGAREVAPAFAFLRFLFPSISDQKTQRKFILYWASSIVAINRRGAQVASDFDWATQNAMGPRSYCASRLNALFAESLMTRVMHSCNTRAFGGVATAQRRLLGA
ncbi:MAG: hypothetical protein M1430_11785, partial [Betaproteobacteria bacterium]|nr:hypothetical protein [Betaproteobacteria bacterium]